MKNSEALLISLFSPHLHSPQGKVVRKVEVVTEVAVHAGEEQNELEPGGTAQHRKASVKHADIKVLVAATSEHQPVQS